MAGKGGVFEILEGLRQSGRIEADLVFGFVLIVGILGRNCRELRSIVRLKGSRSL